jgi:hypothetical protein
MIEESSEILSRNSPTPVPTQIVNSQNHNCHNPHDTKTRAKDGKHEGSSCGPWREQGEREREREREKVTSKKKDVL